MSDRPKLRPKQRELVDLMQSIYDVDGEWPTLRRLADKLDKTHSTIHERLEQLVALGIVEHERQGPYTLKGARGALERLRTEWALATAAERRTFLREVG